MLIGCVIGFVMISNMSGIWNGTFGSAFGEPQSATSVPHLPRSATSTCCSALTPMVATSSSSMPSASTASSS